MKKTFREIAQAHMDGQRVTEAECRAVLGWFGGPSLYFPGEREKKSALDALVWLCEEGPAAEGRSRPEESRAARFAQAFSLEPQRAERLLNGFYDRVDRREPVIIGVEGLDGSGKTVQAAELRKALERRGNRVQVIDFPRYGGFFGREIGGLLAGKDGASALELDEKSMCLWYALDRWQTLGGVNLGAYDYIIFNRYTLSNVVYQSARKYRRLDCGFADWIFELEHIQLGLPIPDVYLYLHTKAELCGENVLKKEGRQYTEGLDVYESSEDLLECCHQLYRELSGEIEEIRVLNCLDEFGVLKSVEEISGAVVGSLREYGLLAEP